MTATITPQHDEFDAEVGTSRRRKITKFALAGVAVLGIGAALTSAAWTDNVWFGGDASSGTVDLIGSADDGATWGQGENESVAIVIPEIAVAPAQSTTRIVIVKNDGDVPVRISSVSPAGHGALFTAADTDGDGIVEDPAEVTAVGGIDAILQPDQEVHIEVQVSAPEWAESQFQDLDGYVTLHVQGSTDL